MDAYRLTKPIQNCILLLCPLSFACKTISEEKISKRNLVQDLSVELQVFSGLKEEYTPLKRAEAYVYEPLIFSTLGVFPNLADSEDLSTDCFDRIIAENLSLQSTGRGLKYAVSYSVNSDDCLKDMLAREESFGAANHIFVLPLGFQAKGEIQCEHEVDESVLGLELVEVKKACGRFTGLSHFTEIDISYRLFEGEEFKAETERVRHIFFKAAKNTGLPCSYNIHADELQALDECTLGYGKIARIHKKPKDWQYQTFLEVTTAKLKASLDASDYHSGTAFIKLNDWQGRLAFTQSGDPRGALGKGSQVIELSRAEQTPGQYLPRRWLRYEWYR